MLDWGSVSWLAVLAAGIAHMIVGAVWFGAFSKPWMADAHPGVTREQMMASGNPRWAWVGYAIGLLVGLFSAYLTSVILRGLGVTTLGPALALTVGAWIAFTAGRYLTTYLFERRTMRLWAIDVGYPLASMLVTTIIVVLWT
jgi:Protein of unknown function (DUF1761)